MKFSVAQENLVIGLQLVNRIATTRATLPILGNILLKTDRGRLKLVTTDLDLAIETTIESNVSAEGAITVPARTLTEFVLNNPDKTINFSLHETELRAKSPHFTAEIKGLEADEFPTVPTIKTKEALTIPGLTLKEAITQTVFATTNDETRPVLGGVAAFVDKKELKLVATDSYRLAEKRLLLEKGLDKELVISPVIIPGRTLLEVSRLISEETAQVTLMIEKHQMVIVCGATRITSRLIEGKFPAYEAIIPKTLATTVTMSRQEFTGALRVACLFSRDSAYNVTFKLGEKALTITALSAQIGSSTATVTAAITGPHLTIAFNARYFLDALQVMTSEAVQLLVQSPKESTWYPGILRSPEDHQYQYIIMPLRTGG